MTSLLLSFIMAPDNAAASQTHETQQPNIANTPAKPIDLAKLRSSYSVLYSYSTADAPAVGRIYDDAIPLADGTPLPVRVYEPAPDGPWPVHLDFHGGGWALGDLDAESHLCRHYCGKTNIVVIDVAYRLLRGAHKFNVRASSISVGGVSAGGFIALALAHLARDAAIPLALVAAGTPVIDDLSAHKTASDSPWPTIRENEFAPTLNWARLAWFDKLKWSSSLSSSSSIPAQADDIKAARVDVGWLANLLDAPDCRDLARTLIFTAGADPMRDEGEAYARRLVESGVHVSQRRFPGVPHPFMHMDKHLWQAIELINHTAREIRIAHWHP